ncbi:MAG: FxsA family protein [Angustibacter sp.]
MRAKTGARGRRTPVVTVLAALLLVVPIIEIAVIVAVGRAIGGWQTLALLVVESAIGAWLVRREGIRAWRALRDASTVGRLPAGELADGVLILVGGTLLLTPGFATDVVGFFFVLPVSRPWARRALARLITSGLAQRGAGTGPVIRGSVVDSDAGATPTTGAPETRDGQGG